MTNEDTLDKLLRELMAEGWAASQAAIPEDAASKRYLLRTLMNTDASTSGLSAVLITEMAASSSPVVDRSVLACWQS